MDQFEIDEAFCSVPVAATRALGIDREICNVNGSGCSPGHPIAATGARMVVSMVHELRRRGARLGRVSMRAGDGMGMAMVVEALRGDADLENVRSARAARADGVGHPLADRLPWGAFPRERERCCTA